MLDKTVIIHTLDTIVWLTLSNDDWGLEDQQQKVVIPFVLARMMIGSGDRARTCNILVNSQALYH